MSVGRSLFAATLAGALALAVSPASSQTLRYANQGELKSLDPYTLNESTTHAHLGHVYEGLVTRDKDLKIIPALAESWETPEPTRWRFHLRKGVKFHNGDPFTADDVVFSAERVRAKGSNLLSRIPADAKVVKVDDYTVDFILTAPNPILTALWATWYIMDKKWAEANDAVAPTPAAATTPSYASLHENGTGPFMIESHQPGVKTVFKANPNWWRKPEHNLKEIIFTPIASEATRVAALLSGEVDVIEPVPVQDIQRVNSSPNATVLTGPELRTIFVGMDQSRDELLYSNIKGKNPFKDIRVREAVYKTIDVDLIKNRVMRGLSTPSALMIAPELYPLSKDFTRPKPDAEAAKKLLAEAGYADGFEVTMDCPNDRYVNDAAICQAIVGMLARINIKVNLLAQPKAQYFAKVLKPGGYKTSFFMLGWTPDTLDSHNVMHDIMGCREDPKDPNRGEANLAGYCNKQFDELADKVLLEPDTTKRDQLIKQAYELAIKDYAYVPLHQQALAWGVSKKVKLTQRADNQVLLYWATKQDE
ncbi:MULTISPECIES: ABC transporter substrate-binding protein [Bradyrhizobium]|jgi:peptide/nickel transport system substrate-binding protein|uniref:ABC transporter substrate-binding protein n=1 Tax=Bradyrhizobium japonicum TaxID=375 RepID=A0A0A3YZH5_BRAJP|nr:ABC transporter substrate-binding protein [Bradyrhizobium japonicum]AJA64679.1 ABC transporter substrate-binding protein [Bradyrhizobium japonicum]KGT79003.1 ABC transporter substrate-binding protein [Bradyrhizobium japonicum]KMJ97278.1 ABC transporter substrate-binding protein [Bradyrhizobium japonicum]MBR0731321.1 ABC transporter substrate-binding protein [Bradyrhizobium japonicum]MBR0761459.1 ABC transporter substrate-binding protein [Bradyrhizobium japonicum]